MFHHLRHPSDETLLRAIDDELSSFRRVRLDRHLAACEPCRTRQQALQRSAEEFSRACRDELMVEGPASNRLRARLHADLAARSRDLDRSWRFRFARGMATVPRPALAVAVVTMTFVAVALHSRSGRFAGPDRVVVAGSGVLPVRSLTPGATRTTQADDLCAGRAPAPHAVPAAVRQAVLRDYGMEAVPAHEYELDYLITPELGGSTDRLNLWPERYAARIWNARVKDDLERLLPELVCDGKVDLVTAQQDIAADWIAAYKKYFRTDQPLPRATNTLLDEDDVMEGATAMASVPAWTAHDPAPHLVSFVIGARPTLPRGPR